MKKLFAYGLKFLFQIKPLRKYYYGIYTRFLKPKNLFKGIKATATINGIKFHLKLEDWIQQNVFLFGEYEKAEFLALTKQLQKDSIFIDIGANIGLYSTYFARQLSEGKVFCFEPFSVNYLALNETLKRNNISNVSCHKLIVGETSQSEINLYYDESEQNLGMVTTLQTNTSSQEAVAMTSLDDFVKTHQITRVDAIKIDVEGAELSVLKGMKHVLETLHPVLLIEILDETTTNSVEILSLLDHYGYVKYYISDDGELSKTATNLQRKNYLFK